MLTLILCVLGIAGIVSLRRDNKNSKRRGTISRRSVIILTSFITVFIGISQMTIKKEKVNTVMEKAQSYPVYLDGNEVSIENINVENYFPYVNIDDDNQKIIISTHCHN